MNEKKKSQEEVPKGEQKTQRWSERLKKEIEVDLNPTHTPEALKKNIGMSNDGGGGVHV